MPPRHRSPAIALLSFLVAAAADAQSLTQQAGYDAFQQTVTIEPRPYEFEILGVKPGMPINDAVRLIEEHLGKELSPLDPFVVEDFLALDVRKLLQPEPGPGDPGRPK